jgi:hypothetical protein
MLSRELKTLRTGARDLRKFGLTVGAVFTALGLALWARGKGHSPWFLAPGLALLALGLALPRALKPVYIAWMALALGLGWVVSHLILTLFFFLVITPVGCVARLLGKDFLRLKLDRQAPTYWLPRRRSKANNPQDYERQY